MAIRLFPVRRVKERLQRRKITQSNFYAIACAPNLITIVQDAWPHFAKLVSIYAPRARGRSAAHLLDEKFSSGRVSLAPVRAVREHLAGKLGSDLCARQTMKLVRP